MPRSRFDRPAANREFTNREPAIEAFHQARKNLPVDCHRILGFHGVGGQGKTALRRYLRDQLTANQLDNHRFGVLDFHVEDYSNAARGLLQLRRSLHTSGSISTPIFDVAITIYWKLAYPGENLTHALSDLLEDSDGIIGDLYQSVRDAFGVAENVPFGVGQIVKIINAAHRWFTKRGAEKACKALQELRGLEADQVGFRLPWFLGLDLKAHREKHPEHGAPILFIDTYEALWSDHPDKTGISSIETDAWVRELVASSPGVLFVFCGRERLSWDRRFPDDDWDELLADQHLLGGLAEPDADWFLRQIPIDDPDVRRAIIEGASSGDDPHTPPGARGAHPFYLDLAVDTWLDLCATGETPTPENFGRTHPEVLARFLRHRDSTEVEVLKVLAGPTAFDYPLFTELIKRFQISYPLTRFEELCTLSIIERGADKRFRLHALMRTHLLEALDPQLREELRAFLFDWYDGRCRPSSPREIDPDHESALVEAFDQLDTTDVETALGWFWERRKVFYDAARYALLEPLNIRALELAENHYGPDHPEVATVLNNLAQLLQATNRLAEAEPLMRRALKIDETSFGPDHPQVAISLNNLAALLKVTNRLAEAEPLMRRALVIDEASFGPDHPKVAIHLNNLAQLLQATNRLAKAEPLMRRALVIDEESYGPDHPNVAIRLNNMAQLLKDTNRMAEAEPLMRRALVIDEESYGPDHPNVAISLNNLAQILYATNRLAEAEPLMWRALKIDEESYGPDHPNVAIRLNNLALLLQDTNRLAEAEPLMRRALKIDEASYGPDHPEVTADLNNLAQILYATNRLAEAEPLMWRALKIDEASFGPDHPQVAIRLNNLATLFYTTNRLAEAEPLMWRALEIDEESYRPDHPDVAIRLNNLAQLLKSTNRFAEAEPLMRRHLVIFLVFSRKTGHQHPHLAAAFNNYRKLLLENGKSEAEVRELVASLGPEAGFDDHAWENVLASIVNDAGGW
jgi:tetratricopeptide (TPR) repeat protein